MTRLFAFCFLLTACTPPLRNQCDNLTSKIKTIGGCDRHGRCGVMLEDGTQLVYAKHPVVGGAARGHSCEVTK